MKNIAVLLTLAASTTLWSLAACAKDPTPASLGDVMVQTQTITQEKTTIREIPPPPPSPGTTVVTVRQAPPALRQEVASPRPSPEQVLIPGYWTWGNNEWVWVYGRWETPPEPTVKWIPGQWVTHGEGWVWHAGRWE